MTDDERFVQEQKILDPTRDINIISSIYIPRDTNICVRCFKNKLDRTGNKELFRHIFICEDCYKEIMGDK